MNKFKIWTDTPPTRIQGWLITTWKKCLISLAIREIQILTLKRYHHIPIRIAENILIILSTVEDADNENFPI